MKKINKKFIGSIKWTLISIYLSAILITIVLFIVLVYIYPSVTYKYTQQKETLNSFIKYNDQGDAQLNINFDSDEFEIVLDYYSSGKLTESQKEHIKEMNQGSLLTKEEFELLKKLFEDGEVSVEEIEEEKDLVDQKLSDLIATRTNFGKIGKFEFNFGLIHILNVLFIGIIVTIPLGTVLILKMK